MISPSENHRLESSYQNHLVLKVLVVSMSEARAAAPCHGRHSSHQCLLSSVQLLQLFRLAVLHRLHHAGHGAAQAGRSARPSSFCRFILAPPGPSVSLESGHPADHQSDSEPAHGSLPAVLAPEETQQEDDPQSPEDNQAEGQGAPSGRAGPPRGSHEHVPGKST